MAETTGDTSGLDNNPDISNNTSLSHIGTPQTFHEKVATGTHDFVQGARVAIKLTSVLDLSPEELGGISRLQELVSRLLSYGNNTGVLSEEFNGNIAINADSKIGLSGGDRRALQPAFAMIQRQPELLQGIDSQALCTALAAAVAQGMYSVAVEICRDLCSSDQVYSPLF
jgi:hypothetical protein